MLKEMRVFLAVFRYPLYQLTLLLSYAERVLFLICTSFEVLEKIRTNGGGRKNSSVKQSGRKKALPLFIVKEKAI